MAIFNSYVSLPEGINWHEPPSESSSIVDLYSRSQTPSGLPSAPFFASGAYHSADSAGCLRRGQFGCVRFRFCHVSEKLTDLYNFDE